MLSQMCSRERERERERESVSIDLKCYVALNLILYQNSYSTPHLLLNWASLSFMK